MQRVLSCTCSEGGYARSTSTSRLRLFHKGFTRYLSTGNAALYAFGRLGRAVSAPGSVTTTSVSGLNQREDQPW